MAHLSTFIKFIEAKKNKDQGRSAYNGPYTKPATRDTLHLSTYIEFVGYRCPVLIPPSMPAVAALVFLSLLRGPVESVVTSPPTWLRCLAQS
jgi:hypothetical protein